MAAAAQAAPEITKEKGWSGYVSIGAGAGQSETNMLASISSIDLGDDRISSLDEDAGSEDITFPALRFEAAYTLGEIQTQFFVRNQTSDYVFLDLEVHGGIRQQVTGIGIIDISLSGTSVPTDVWKDPYLVGANRGDTERSSVGLHLNWRNIMDSPLEFEFSSKEIEVDDEDSGDSLPLTPAQRRLLEREGQVYRFNFLYTWAINEQHSLVPEIAFLDYDLDGQAMSEDGYGVSLTHHYQRGRWHFATQVQYRGLDADEDNPIYDEAGDKDILSAAFTASYSQPFGWEHWSANASALWYDEDSDIDFYDTSLGAVSIGMQRRF
jgi:hypothetical protein